MERTAILERLTWQPALVEAIHAETLTARTLSLSVPGWTGHRPGQHVDLRVTAPDGYTAQRPYSIGSEPAAGTLALTVEAIPGGEVSPFLAHAVKPGVTVEIRGPLGGWFVWSMDQDEPVQLIGGGSGVVPLMSMLRTHRAIAHPSPMRLLYSVRAPQALLYAGDLNVAPVEPSITRSAQAPQRDGRRRADDVVIVYSRQAPPGHGRLPRRLSSSDIALYGLPADQSPTCYVCGPTPFVEAVNALLLNAGHQPEQIRAERFGAGRT